MTLSWKSLLGLIFRGMTSYQVYRLFRSTETADNRQYIGITSKTIEERLKKHRTSSKRANPKLWSWLIKYQDVLAETLHSELTKEQALKLKEELIPASQIERDAQGFLNLVSGGGCPRFWTDLSEEEKQARREKIGSKHRGKVMSLESRKKMSQSRQGRSLSEEHKKHIGLALSLSKKKYRSQFEVQAPDGTVHKGTNLRVFCKKWNLERANMTAVIQGRRKSHKGWKRIGE